MRKRVLYVGITAIAATTALAAGAHGRAPAQPPASRFTAHVDNPWFPLEPGRTYVYTGVRDGKPAREILTVTNATRTIAGAPCAVIRDLLYLKGRLAERTTDWYTQDKRGNVWYFGEQTAELDAGGHVKSTEGSWQAGVDGAKPGIFMPGKPRVGQTFRQEYYKGHAEDHFRVIAVFENALLTEEWTPLEPGAIDHKLYVRGAGTVLERAVKGGNELLELVSLR